MGYMACYRCACNHCVYNAELESWYITLGEIKNVEDICYCCDECRHYDGDCTKRSRWRQKCKKKKLPCKYIVLEQNPKRNLIIFARKE